MYMVWLPQKTDQNASVPPLGLQLADPLDSGSDCWGSDTCFEEEWSANKKKKKYAEIIKNYTSFPYIR